MAAKEYVGKSHTILKLESAGLVARYLERIELAHMNTGNTLPFPHKRGRSTFRKLEDNPYESRQRLKDYSAVVELTVIGGVPDIRDYVQQVEHGTVRNGHYHVCESIL